MKLAAQIIRTMIFIQNFQQIRCQAKKFYLREVQNHRQQSNPRMQGVQVGLGRLGKVVRVKRSHQTKEHHDENNSVQTRMGELELLLAIAPQRSVD